MAEAWNVGRASAEVEPSAAGWCDGAKRYPNSTAPFHIWQPMDSSNKSRNCTMSRGAQGPAVEALQEALVRCNQEADIAIDGIFGHQTESALIAAQGAAGVATDGVYGPNTRKAIEWQVYPGPVTCRQEDYFD